MKYAIFNQEFDCEIHLTFNEGNLDSLSSVRDEIVKQLRHNHSLENGIVEQYPFYQVQWEIVGGRFEPNFNFNQVLEV